MLSSFGEIGGIVPLHLLCLHPSVFLLRGSVRTRVVCASVFIIVASFLSVSLSSHLQLGGTQVFREGVATPAVNRHRCDITSRGAFVLLLKSCHPKTAIHTALRNHLVCVSLVTTKRACVCPLCVHEMRLVIPAPLSTTITLCSVTLHRAVSSIKPNTFCVRCNPSRIHDYSVVRTLLAVSISSGCLRLLALTGFVPQASCLKLRILRVPASFIVFYIIVNVVLFARTIVTRYFSLTEPMLSYLDLRHLAAFSDGVQVRLGTIAPFVEMLFQLIHDTSFCFDTMKIFHHTKFTIQIRSCILFVRLWTNWHIKIYRFHY